MAACDFAELLKLSPDDSLQLGEDLVESVALENPDFPLGEEQPAEHRADPASSIPWKVVRRRLRDRYGA